MATEWGHLLGAGTLLLVLIWPGWSKSRPGKAGALLGTAAALLFFTPVMRAVPVALQLPAQIESAFPGAGPAFQPSPLSLVELFFGVGYPKAPVKTIPYITREGKFLEMDVTRPVSGPAPVVIMVHGGSWQGGSRTDLSALNHYLTARGYVTAAISYRLAPEHKFPAQKEDVLAAVAYLKRNAEALGVDPTRIVLMGRSAGGQLALIAGYTANDPAIRGVISLYGPVDLEWGFNNPGKILDSQGTLRAYLGGSPTESALAYRAAIPLNWVGPETPPTLLIHGENDHLVSPEHVRRLAPKLKEAYRPHLALWLPWGAHGCDYNFSGPCGQISTYAIERFLSYVMKQ